MNELGCYGLPSTYSTRSAACSKCPARPACSAGVQQVLQAIAGLVDVLAFQESPIVRYASVSAEPEQTTVMSAPVKVRSRLERMIQTGARARAQDALGRGVSPFPADKDKALAFAGDALLRTGFTRQSLREHLVGLGWSEGAAKSHVSNTLALLRGLQLIEEEGGRFVASRQIQPLPMNP